MAEKEEQKIALCPFLNSPCIMDKCAVYVKIQKRVLGGVQVIGVCSLPAVVMVMTTPPPPLPMGGTLDLSQIGKG